MAEASITELQRGTSDILARVVEGEDVTITRDGKPIAELRAVAGEALSAVALLARWRGLPAVDPALFRADLDGVVGGGLLPKSATARDRRR